MLCQEVIDRARTMTVDKYRRRYSDADLLGWLKDFLLWVYNTRPDYFIGRFSSFPTIATVNDTYPLEDRTVPMAELYIVARAEFPDNQNVASERVTASFNMLEKAAHG